MNIQEYISSGIVESYVLGLAGDTERAEFEQMCGQYPEVKAAREAFEVSLEQHALESAVQPPVTVRDKIYQQLGMQTGTGNEQVVSNVTKTIPAAAKDAAPVVKMNWSRYLAAASVILLVASAALNFYFFNRYKEYNARYEELLAQNTELVKNSQATRASLQEYQAALDMLKNPGMNMIKMKGDAVPTGSPDPSSMATVFWDSRSKDVYLVVNQLPQPAADKQYQLWAIVDGQPVDAGIFTLDHIYLKMKNIPRAQAFAITLEKKGGNPTPQGDMYVLGKS